MILQFMVGVSGLVAAGLALYAMFQGAWGLAVIGGLYAVMVADCLLD